MACREESREPTYSDEHLINQTNLKEVISCVTKAAHTRTKIPNYFNFGQENAGDPIRYKIRNNFSILTP